jgi:type I restriction enzyme M protein
MASTDEEITPSEAVSRVNDPECSTYLGEMIEQVGSEAASRMAEAFDADTLKSVVLSDEPGMDVFSSEHSTPTCLSDLAVALLDIKPGETVVDYGCGRGNFLTSAMHSCSGAEYTGFEIDMETACLARIRTSLVPGNAHVVTGDMFDDSNWTHADKLFSNYPFGMKLRDIKGKGSYLARSRQGLPEYGSPRSGDWVFNRYLYDSIKGEGRAVTFTTGGALFNGMDRRIRRYFVENGMINAVIALPPRMFPQTQIQVFAVVFSHANASVRMVDATDLCKEGRRQNTIDEKGIAEVLLRLEEDGEKSKPVAPSDIQETRYDLSPDRYLRQEIVIENPTPLGDVAESFTRGASLRATELDALITRRDTGISYVMLADITDGRMKKDLPHLRELDRKLEKYCLENGDLLISKMGLPFKVAVAAVPEGVRILANGNLFVVRLDANKVDPSYVAAFLSGRTGQELLSRAAVGTTIPSIPVNNLKDVPIPLLPMERQRDIAARYQAKLDEIELLQIKVEKAREESVSLFEDGD